ncbi:MAG TPA: DUF2752 domain-containing protein [Holophaga sp.]|nr:DUF2752 domain-containing protein [Holophaga sp.]HQL48742.1 DUF2752 domain-containing protein [Holophaga sp.]
MRIHFFRASRWPRVPMWALGLCLGWLLLVAWVWWLEQRTGITPETCLVHGAFGIPCPTCGSTRVVTRLLEGRWAEALRFNPLVFLGLAGGMAALAVRFTTGWWFRFDLSLNERAWILAGGVALLLANWAWVLRVQ